jgi:hypothetical protein
MHMGETDSFPVVEIRDRWTGEHHEVRPDEAADFCAHYGAVTPLR